VSQRVNVADKSCERQKMTCEDYQGNDEDECLKISYNLDDRDTYSCRMIDGKCKKEYRYCSDYRGTDKAKCEAIRVDPFKCVYDTKDKVATKNLELAMNIKEQIQLYVVIIIILMMKINVVF
jgi:hypothetical protein